MKCYNYYFINYNKLPTMLSQEQYKAKKDQIKEINKRYNIVNTERNELIDEENAIKKEINAHLRAIEKEAKTNAQIEEKRICEEKRKALPALLVVHKPIIEELTSQINIIQKKMDDCEKNYNDGNISRKEYGRIYNDYTTQKQIKSNERYNKYREFNTYCVDHVNSRGDIINNCKKSTGKKRSRGCATCNSNWSRCVYCTYNYFENYECYICNGWSGN
jgi:hypothetical protein